jgi:hypothetical protein
MAEVKNYNTLYEKYKRMFTTDSMRPAAMFGFECQIGWYDILERLMRHIHAHLKHGANPEIVNNFRIVQIKEKFGSLRFYVESGDDVINTLIRITEDISYETCEYCGSNQNVFRSIGWIVTACKPCIETHDRLKRMEWGDVWKPIELKTI